MKSKFIKGVIKGLAYYAIGFIVAWLVYIVFGWDYKHAPGFHHIISALLLLGGAGWAMYYLVLAVIGLKSKVNFGLLTVHICTLLLIVLYFTIDLRSEDFVDYQSNPADILTINREPVTNISSIVNGEGDTLYSMRGDSIIIDRITNDTVNRMP